MDDLGSTVRARRKELRLTLQQLADMSGCAKSYLSQIENNHRGRGGVPVPSEALVYRIEQALRLEHGALARLRNWRETPAPIRREHEELRRENASAKRLVELLRESGLDRLNQTGELRRLVERIDAAGDAPRLTPLPVQVPIINKVRAGYPTEFTDLGYPARVADEYISTPDLYDPQAFAARIVGDSMAPDYREGDVVVFSPERDTPAGSDCFVRLDRDNESTFKRVYFERDPGGRQMIRLQPINPAHPPRILPREEVAGMYAAVYVVRSVGPR